MRVLAQYIPDSNIADVNQRWYHSRGKSLTGYCGLYQYRCQLRNVFYLYACETCVNFCTEHISNLSEVMKRLILIRDFFIIAEWRRTHKPVHLLCKNNDEFLYWVKALVELNSAGKFSRRGSRRALLITPSDSTLSLQSQGNVKNQVWCFIVSVYRYRLLILSNGNDLFDASEISLVMWMIIKWIKRQHTVKYTRLLQD